MCEVLTTAPATECNCPQRHYCSVENEEGGLDQGITETSPVSHWLSQFIENRRQNGLVDEVLAG